jgi:hypothetical protein
LEETVATVALGMWRRVQRRAFFALLFSLVASVSEARPYRLLWDANTDGVTDGYIVYIGTASNTYVPAAGVDVGNVTEHQLNLVPGTTYYFRVRAYDEDDVQGPLSEELVFTVPNSAPVLTNPGTKANAPSNVVSLNLLATDPDGDGLVFTSVSGLPPGLNANGAGQITGTISAGGSGTYTVTATVSDGSAQDVEVFTWRVLSFTGPPSVNQGDTITATIAHAPGSAGDWVGLYRIGAAVGEYCDWKYLNGTKTQPGAPLTTASVNFTSNCPGAGDLQLRFFVNNTVTVLATAGPISVNAIQGGQITINGTVPPASVAAAAGSTLSTQVAITGPTYAGDWVGLYPVGGAVGQYVDWKYLNGTRSKPASGTANATVNFSMPAAPGSFEIRLYSNDTATLVATSSALSSAQNGAIAVNGVSPPNGISAASGTPLTVDVTITGASYPGDWVGLYPVGGTVGEWLDWKYMNGTRVVPGAGSAAASLSFTMPSGAGPFELRVYSNNTSSQIGVSSTISRAQSAAITLNGVNPPAGLTANGGSTLTADIVIAGPNFAGDWAGLFPVGGTTGQWIDWKYLNGTRTPPASGTASATLSFTMPEAAGNYEVRVYSNNTTGLAGSSSTVTTTQNATISVNTVTPPSSVYVVPASSMTIGISITGPNYPGDWAGLFRVGGALGEYLEWKYMNGANTTPAAGSANASLNFTAPVSPGSYEMRLFSNNTGTLVGTGPTMHVSVIAVDGTHRPIVYSTSAGAPLSVQVQIAGPPNAGDWVGLFPVGGTTGQWIEWKYLSGTQVMPGGGSASATLNFTAPSSAGTYEIRLYHNNTVTLMSIGPTITVP